MPLLARERPDLDVALSQLCDRLRADEEALSLAADDAFARLAGPTGLEVRGLSALPWALFVRVVQRVAPVPFEDVHLRDLQGLIQSTNGTQFLNVPGGVLERAYERLRFISERPADPGDVELAVTGAGTYALLETRVLVSPELLLHGPLVLRNARAGDRVRLGALHRKLQDLLTDAKVPRDLRRRLPLLVRRLTHFDEVLWIGSPGCPGGMRAVQECSLTRPLAMQ
jgi:tRNA(Ile)-lysidine synthetase-like protein